MAVACSGIHARGGLPQFRFVPWYRLGTIPIMVNGSSSIKIFPPIERASAISSETIATRPPAMKSSSSRNALPATGGNSSIEKKLPVTASTGNRSLRSRHDTFNGIRTNAESR